jgi:hypothetical protein
MTMPRTYAYNHPMKVGVSDQIYRDIVSNIPEPPLRRLVSWVSVKQFGAK